MSHCFFRCGSIKFEYLVGYYLALTFAGAAQVEQVTASLQKSPRLSSVALHGSEVRSWPPTSQQFCFLSDNFSTCLLNFLWPASYSVFLV